MVWFRLRLNFILDTPPHHHRGQAHRWKVTVSTIFRQLVMQWRRCEIWGLVRSSHRTVSDYTLRRWFPVTEQSRFPTACRRLEKSVLPYNFDTTLSSLMTWNLHIVIRQQFWMKECDIFGAGWKYTRTPHTYFQGGQDPQPPGSP